MNGTEMICRAEAYVRELFADDSSGHDAEHTFRVCRTALRIADAEGADRLTVALAALLHDVDDPKLFPSPGGSPVRASAFLAACGAAPALTERIVTILGEVSYKGTDSVIPSTIEGCCVQDADRLDAMGAIGIARCFAYGGSRGRKLYDPAEPPVYGLDEAGYRARSSHSVNHIYEKLLHLRDLMTTDEGRRLAKRRHQVLSDFLEEFLAEWDGNA